jgi:hypothetical protein
MANGNMMMSIKLIILDVRLVRVYLESVVLEAVQLNLAIATVAHAVLIAARRSVHQDNVRLIWDQEVSNVNLNLTQRVIARSVTQQQELTFSIHQMHQQEKSAVFPRAAMSCSVMRRVLAHLMAEAAKVQCLSRNVRIMYAHHYACRKTRALAVTMLAHTVEIQAPHAINQAECLANLRFGVLER